MHRIFLYDARETCVAAINSVYAAHLAASPQFLLIYSDETPFNQQTIVAP